MSPPGGATPIAPVAWIRGFRVSRAPTPLGRLTFAIVVLGLLWRGVVYAVGMPVWGDEAFLAVNFIQRGFAEMVEPLLYAQVAPLGFLWAELAATRLLGLSEWALRLVPFLGGIAALLAFWWFAKRVMPRSAAHLSVAILAASYYVTRHTAELKPYATDLLVAVLLIAAAWAVLTNPHSPRRWIVLTVAAGLAVWCSYPSVFISGAIALVLPNRLWRMRSAGGAYAAAAAYGFVLCGSFAAMYYLIAQPHTDVAPDMIDNWRKAFPPLDQPWKLLVWLVAVHTGPMFAYPQGGSWPASIVTFALFIIGAVRTWRTNRDLFWLLVLPFGLSFVAALLEKYPYGVAERVSQYLGPAICLLAGQGWAVVLGRFLRGARKYRNGLLVSTLALALLPVGGMVRSLVKPYKAIYTQRGHDAVRAVADRTAAGDCWIIFNADRPAPYAPFLGDWRGIGATFVFDALRFGPADIRFAPPPDTLTPVPGRTAWLLFYKAENPKFESADALWDAYVAAAARRLGPAEHSSYPIRDTSDRGQIIKESLEVLRFSPAPPD